MVLDCTAGQLVKIRILPDQMRTASDIDFSFFETRQTLMTCLLFNHQSSQHSHFIDEYTSGGRVNGGEYD